MLIIKKKKKNPYFSFKYCFKKLPSKKHLQNYHIDKKQNFDLKCFEDEISRLGYEFVDIVQDKGEISIRADIIDIFVSMKKILLEFCFLAKRLKV